MSHTLETKIVEPNGYHDCYGCWFEHKVACVHICDDEGEQINIDKLNDADYALYEAIEAQIEKLNG